FKYVFDVKETNPVSWLDFPTLGYDSDALFVSGNVFGFNPGTFQHVTLRIFDKATLLSGLPVTPNALVMPAGQQSFTLSPAVSHDQTTTEWMTETSAAFSGTSTFFSVWKISNALNANPTIVATTLPVPAYSAPVVLDQKGSARQL